MPRNCTECENKKACQSFYGWLGCEHKDAVLREGKENEEKSN